MRKHIFYAFKSAEILVFKLICSKEIIQSPHLNRHARALRHLVKLTEYRHAALCGIIWLCLAQA